MRNRQLVTVLLGCGLGVASSAGAQVPSLVAGTFVTATGINAIVDAVNSVGAYQGNLDLPATTPTTGLLRVNGTRFLHNFGALNTFLGEHAGSFTMEVCCNTGVGDDALDSSTTGNDNTAVGQDVLRNADTGNFDTAVSDDALRANTGWNNTVVGQRAEKSATTGHYNIYL